MAFQTGTSSSLENLLTQLSTFAVANGWTEDFFTAEGANPGRMGLSKGGVFVTFMSWESDGVIGIGANTSNDDSADPWLSTGDDGQLYSNPDGFPNSIDSRRCVNNAAGPHVAYWFFEQNANPSYIHVVVEVDTNRFRHFGFGNIEKIGDWVGGEYVYGHFWSQSATQIDAPGNTGHSFLLDARAQTAANHAAGMRASGLSVMPALGEWLMFITAQASPVGIDRAGNPRANGFGCSRSGPAQQAFSWVRLSQLSAFKPLIPTPLFFSNTGLTPDSTMLLGTMPDVRMVNIANIEPGEIITIAGEDWYMFPWVRKQFLKNDTEESWNGGVAYRRENA